VESDDLYMIYEDEIRESFGKVCYTHKTHLKMMDLLRGRFDKLKHCQILLSALTASTLVAYLVKSFDWAPVVAAILALILTYLNTALKEGILLEQIRDHKDTASEIWIVRESFISLIADIKTRSVTVLELRTTRDQLNDTLKEIYKRAPETNAVAYERARKALQFDGEHTFEPNEVDPLLPPGLRRSTN